MIKHDEHRAFFKTASGEDKTVYRPHGMAKQTWDAWKSKFPEVQQFAEGGEVQDPSGQLLPPPPPQAAPAPAAPQQDMSQLVQPVNPNEVAQAQASGWTPPAPAAQEASQASPSGASQVAGTQTQPQTPPSESTGPSQSALQTQPQVDTLGKYENRLEGISRDQMAAGKQDQKDLDKLKDDQIKAAQSQSKVVQEQNDLKAADAQKQTLQAQNDVAKEQATQQEWKQKTDALMQHHDNLQKEIASSPTSSREYIKGLGLGGKVSAFFGTIFGGIGGRGHGNSYLDSIQNQIDKSLDKKKFLVGQDEQMMKQITENYHTQHEQNAAVSSLVYTAMAKQLEGELAKTQNPAEQARLQGAIADLGQKALEKKAELRKSTAASVVQSTQAAAGVNEARQKLGIERDVANAKAGKGAGGKQITEGTTQKIAANITSYNLVKDFKSAFNTKTGPLSFMSKFVPGTNASNYEDARRILAQRIGTSLEGGKLTDADFGKYLAMIPSASEFNATGQNKLNKLLEVIRNGTKTDIDTLRNSGYNTHGLESSAGNIYGDADQAAHADRIQGGNRFTWDPSTQKYKYAGPA